MTDHETVAFDYLKNVVEKMKGSDDIEKMAAGIQAADLILRYTQERRSQALYSTMSPAGSLTKEGLNG